MERGARETGASCVTIDVVLFTYESLELHIKHQQRPALAGQEKVTDEGHALSASTKIDLPSTRDMDMSRPNHDI